MKHMAATMVATGLTIMACLVAGSLIGLIAAVAYNTFKVFT